MSDPTFNLFGAITKNDIKVGYISTERGYVQGVDICAANLLAKKNPGETFIYKPDRKTVNFLNINQVNELGEKPDKANKDKSCPDGLNMNATPGPPRVVFMGGGGVGAAANPVISNDGRVMAIDLVSPGYGYQYPPIVKIHDDSGIGAGAVAKVGVGTVADQTIYYTDEDEFEEYNICTNRYTDGPSDGGKNQGNRSKKSPYGRRWSPEGKDLGPWIPKVYTEDKKIPFSDVLDEYIKKLNESGKDWWTTRKEPPLQITSDGKTTKSFYKVQHWTWGPGSKTPLSNVTFDIRWHSPHRTKGLGFHFIARDGSHSFKVVDISKKNDGSRKDVYQVRENVTYDVKVIGKRPPQNKKGTIDNDKVIHLAELGLLKKLGGTQGGKNIDKFKAETGGTGDKIFADFLDTLDDADDLQVAADRGKFTAKNARKVEGKRGKRTTYDLTYRLQTGRVEIPPGFMNSYAISPKPPSNAKGSDFAGRWFTFEWDIDFPYNGEYVFHTARDNRSRISIDGESYTDKLVTFTGTNPLSGKVSPKKGYGNKITLSKGKKRLKLELYNEPEKGELTQQQPPPPASKDVTFKITTGSMFGNGVRIEGLDIDESKPFTKGQGQKAQLNVTHERKIEYGKKYKVVFTSKGKEGTQGDIKYTGLHPVNKKIRLARGAKRIELLDGDGNDTNFSLEVDSGKAKFSSDGRKLQGTGNIKLTASWRDDVYYKHAVDSIQIGDKIWRRKGRTGSQTHVITLAGVQPEPIRLRTKDPNVIQMEEFHDNDWTDLIVVASAGQFTDLKGNIAYFSVPHPPKKTGKSEGSKGQKTAEVFNTIDYINKANRKLWRTNVYSRGGFLNDYGVCPFNTNIQLKDNPYAGTHKIVWPNVNFPIDGNYDIEVEVDDNVDLKIGDQVKINKKGFIGDTDVGTGKLKLTRYIKAGNHTITADLYQKPGGAYSFRAPDGKQIQKSEVNFKVSSSSLYANKITIPGLFSVGKEYGGEGAQINQTVTRQVNVEKEYDVILSSVQSKNVRIRLKDNGRRLEMEDYKDGDWQDIVCTINRGEFYGVQGNRCKFRVDNTVKGINPMALAINIETTYSKKEVIVQKSWNENPMGVALTIDAPPPPIPQEPVPKAEGRCPNNPFWTTRFPGAKEKWYPVRYDGWGKLLNQHGISPLPPYDEDRQPLVDVPFEVHWYSPHRTKGLGYRFTSQDGSHTFTIRDTAKVRRGNRKETQKVKLNTTYNVKVIGQRAAPQGTINDEWGDNSKVIELAEQGLLKKLGKTAQGKDNDKFKKGSEGTGDIIFADFLDTLDDADDLQIQAGAGQFTASNPKKVNALKGQRTTYDLTYRVSQIPPNESGSFTNSWTKTFESGGYYKAKMEVDDIGELWVDDKKILDLDRRRNKTFDEKLVYIDGPVKHGDPAVNHEIKVVVENFSSAKTKDINAKVFNTMDWIGGGTVKPEKKVIRFKITSGSMFANSIKIPELGIHESKAFTPVSQGQRGQINVTREKEVEVNKVYDVEFFSSSKGSQKNWGIKYNGVKRPFRVIRRNKAIQFDDNPGNGFDVNASFTIDRGNVKFSDDGERLIVNGNEATFTLDWNDRADISGRALQSIQIGNKTWRITKDRRGSVTKTVKFSSGSDNTGNIKLRNDGESVVRMEDHFDNDWTDIICAATEGRFFDFNGNKCKYVVGSETQVAGGVGGGTTRRGVTYQGPHLFHYTDSRWGKVINREGVSPIGTPTQSLSDPNDNIGGKKILTWKNVDFPQTGKYQINLVADNIGTLFIDDKEVLKVQDNFKENEYNIKNIDVGKGKHTIRIELVNGTASNVFLKDPTGVALRIYTRMTVGTGTYKSWKENPIGVSAKLIPPPCPRKIKGKGRLIDPIVEDTGEYPPPTGTSGYPVVLKMKPPIVKDPGINYKCGDPENIIRLEPSNGVTLSMCQCGPFGRVEKICIEGEGYFTEPPDVIIESPTGVNLDIALQFEVVRVPPDIPDIIQVTDLVGIKKTGYYKGKPYYGAVFYENGIKYSGWYKTAGEMVQVYDTLQESIDGMVTTPPSAILRQGSDPGGNDPRLNIPGTPENLI